MQATKTNTLRVPGANLYHEVRGSGPVLLLICGGVYDDRRALAERPLLSPRGAADHGRGRRRRVTTRRNVPQVSTCSRSLQRVG
jgi:hypothetical protein